MNKRQSVKVGDRVRFRINGKRLKGTQVGTVTRIRASYSRKRKKLAASIGIYDDGYKGELAEVDVDGFSGYASVPVRDLEVIGEASDTFKAMSRVAEAKVKRRNQQARKANANCERATAAGLDGLRAGDIVEVQYVGGYWLKRTFLGFTASNRVRFEETSGRTRYASPGNVRIPKVEQNG